MRKLMAILVLALIFVGLTPLAAAQLQLQTRTRADENATPIAISAGDGLQARTTIAIANRTTVRVRQITKERLEAAQQRYDAARQRHVVARQNYIQARQMLNQTRDKYKECKRETTEECVGVRKETKANTRNYLLGAADRVISMLEKLKERIEMSEDMSEEEAQARIAEIDAKITEIEGARETIGELDNESNSAQIRNAVKEIKQSWTRAKIAMKKSAGRLINAKIGGVIVKSEKLSARLENAIGKLAEQGQDTSGLEELMGDFNTRLESARQHYEEAREQYRGADTDRKVDEAMKEANRHMQVARNELREAHATLVKLMRQIRAARGGDKALEEAEEEETEEEDEAEEEEELEEETEEEGEEAETEDEENETADSQADSNA